jgi:hypothetical protein
MQYLTSFSISLNSKLPPRELFTETPFFTNAGAVGTNALVEAARARKVRAEVLTCMMIY